MGIFETIKENIKGFTKFDMFMMFITVLLLLFFLIWQIFHFYYPFPNKSEILYILLIRIYHNRVSRGGFISRFKKGFFIIVTHLYEMTLYILRSSKIGLRDEILNMGSNTRLVFLNTLRFDFCVLFINLFCLVYYWFFINLGFIYIPILSELFITKILTCFVIFFYSKFIMFFYFFKIWFTFRIISKDFSKIFLPYYGYAMPNYLNTPNTINLQTHILFAINLFTITYYLFILVNLFIPSIDGLVFSVSETDTDRRRVREIMHRLETDVIFGRNT